MNDIKQEDEIYCPECGKVIKKDFAICPYCRTELKKENNIKIESSEPEEDYFDYKRRIYNDVDEKTKKRRKRNWIISLSVIGAVILIVILGAIFNWGEPAYSSSKTIESLEAIRAANETAETTLPTEPIKPINVKYIVLGYSSVMDSIPPKVSVTYSNSQSGTEQINDIVLKKTPSELGLSKKDLGEDSYTKLRGEIIANYEDFPKDGFLYISAQNQNDFGNTLVIILINGIIWKDSLAKGGYSIATASS